MNKVKSIQDLCDYINTNGMDIEIQALIIYLDLIDFPYSETDLCADPKSLLKLSFIAPNKVALTPISIDELEHRFYRYAEQ